MIIDGWFKGYIERKRQRKVDGIRLKNWAKLYEKLNRIKVHCEICDSFGKCYLKYGKVWNKWPKIDKDGNDVWPGCRQFLPRKLEDDRQVLKITPPHQPPWRRGANSCNRKCTHCPHRRGSFCTKS